MAEKKFTTNLLNDLTFKKLFASEETKDITKHFLNEVVGIPVKKVSLRPSEVYSVARLAELAKENDIVRTKVDLLVDLDNGQLATIELQNKLHSYFTERSLFYMSKGYMSSYNDLNEKTSKYSSLRSIYGVNIVNFTQHPEEITDEVMRYVLKNEKYDITLKSHRTGSDLWTLIFFELPKVTEHSIEILQEWKNLFLTGKVSETAPEHLKKAANFIDFENLESEERQMYIDFDEHEAIHEAEMDGARQEGRQEGRAEGAERNAIQTALNFLKMGLAPEQIAKGTGLTLDILKKIQNDNHLNPA